MSEDAKLMANELIKAWQDWESHPGTDFTAHRMEEAIQRTAAYVHVPPSRLRDALSEKRRTGKSVARVVRLLFETIEEEHAQHPGSD